MVKLAEIRRVLTIAAAGALELSELAICGIHIGVGGARLHQVYGDIARPELASQAAREREKGGFSHVVHGPAASVITGAIRRWPHSTAQS